MTEKDFIELCQTPNGLRYLLAGGTR
jgi:hypothetical protein